MGGPHMQKLPPVAEASWEDLVIFPEISSPCSLFPLEGNLMYKKGQTDLNELKPPPSHADEILTLIIFWGTPEDPPGCGALSGIF